MGWPLFEQREGGGEARNKFQVKSCNGREFTRVLIAVEKGGRRRSMNSVLRYQETLQEKRARKRCGSGYSLTVVGADVIVITVKKDLDKQV